MDRRVERRLIDKWIDQNGPDGLLKLALKSNVSSSTISKARLGVVPKKQFTRDRICEAMGLSENRLFPIVRSDGERAS